MTESQRHRETLQRMKARGVLSKRSLEALAYAIQAMEREDDYRAACEAALVWILGHYVEGDEQRALARDRLRAALAKDGSVLMSREG